MTPRQDAEGERLRREILEDVGALLREHLVAESWGRLLVEVVPGPRGEPVVAEMEVEGIVGDETRVDAAFADEPTVRPLLPVLAKATEALCGIEDVELERVQGGTWLRQADGAFAWLPGLVRMPSPALERRWDEACAQLDATAGATEDQHGLRTLPRRELDPRAERIVFASVDGKRRVEGRATLLGSYSKGSRTWAWAGHNASLPAPLRAASAALVDAIADREVRELSTPMFATDEPTVRALCAIVCAEAGGVGVHREVEGENALYFLLRELRASP